MNSNLRVVKMILVELCLILRMAMNEGHRMSYEYKIVPSAVSMEKTIDQTMNVGSDEAVVVSDLGTQLDKLSGNNPLSQTKLQPSSTGQWSHAVPLRKPFFLTKLIKPPKYGYSSFFSKSIFEPLVKRHRPITLVTFRKNSVTNSQP